MQTKPPRTRLIIAAGTGILLVLALFEVLWDEPPPTTPPSDSVIAKQAPSLESHPQRAEPTLLTDRPEKQENVIPFTGEEMRSFMDTPTEQIYFLTEQDYFEFVSELSILLEEALGGSSGVMWDALPHSIDLVSLDDLPPTLNDEPEEIRETYRELLLEKLRWDQYRESQYENILESSVEPRLLDIRSLGLEKSETIEYFNELERALKLHTRLIRDVRLFHDEIQYQKKLLDENRPYQLYDLKFELPPFSRESALSDAMQQAMSALSVGIYRQEASEVLDRLGNVLTDPVRRLYDQVLDPSVTTPTIGYNYDIYRVYGKKVMDYSDSLARQTLLDLESSALGELDFVNRRLFESFYDLYEAGQIGSDLSLQLDLEALEREIYMLP